MTAPLVHYRSPCARPEDPCLCGVSADDSPHVCLATALEALADHACAVCLASRPEAPPPAPTTAPHPPGVDLPAERLARAISALRAARRGVAVSGHLDRTVCDRDPYDTPHVRVAGAMLSRAAIACPTCLAHVRDPESAAAQIARLDAQADAAREAHRQAQGRAAAAEETARAALSEIAHCNRQIRALRGEEAP